MDLKLLRMLEHSIFSTCCSVLYTTYEWFHEQFFCLVQATKLNHHHFLARACWHSGAPAGQTGVRRGGSHAQKAPCQKLKIMVFILRALTCMDQGTLFCNRRLQGAGVREPRPRIRVLVRAFLKEGLLKSTFRYEGLLLIGLLQELFCSRIPQHQGQFISERQIPHCQWLHNPLSVQGFHGHAYTWFKGYSRPADSHKDPGNYQMSTIVQE